MKRTSNQNSYYWGKVVQDALAFYTANPARFFLDVHDALRDEEGAQIVHALLKILFNGAHSTQFKDDETGTGTEKMIKYTDAIREHFFHKHHHDIPPPNTPRIES